MQVLIAACDYHLNITLASFSNPKGLCADRTCGLEPPCPDNTCEYNLSVCIRQAQTPVSTVRMANQGECRELSQLVSSIIKGSSSSLNLIGKGVIWVSILSSLLAAIKISKPYSYVYVGS